MNITPHRKIPTSKLRRVPLWILNDYNINRAASHLQARICHSCRLQFQKQENKRKTDCDNGSNDVSVKENISEVISDKMHSALSGSAEGTEEIIVRQDATSATDNTLASEHDHENCEVLNSLKHAFAAAPTYADKVKIMALLPQNWTIAKIASEVSCISYLITRAKVLTRNNLIFSKIAEKRGKILPEETTELVKELYNSDDYSRVRPGKKDFVTVRHKGTKEQIQKRLVLCNLKELYSSFKEKYPEIKVGFFKFAELRPPHGVLAGANGTHSVCVCMIHQNIKLMIDGAKIQKLTQPGFTVT